MGAKTVEYNNELNHVVLKNLSANELNIFFVICSILKNQNNSKVSIDFETLKKETDDRRHYTLAEYSEYLLSLCHKLLSIEYVDDNGDNRKQFNLISSYEVDTNKQRLNIFINIDYLYLFNCLIKDFTRFELSEFVHLKYKYSKHLYRLLKEYRRIGVFTISIDKLRSLIDVSKSYQMRDITKRIIVPSVLDLRVVPCFRNLEYEYKYRGRSVEYITFTWDSETREFDDE